MANHAVKQRQPARIAGRVLIFLLCLFVYTAHAQTLHAAADQQNLAAHPEWHNLLHFKNGRSEIDDPAFFLASNGKSDAYAELHASLNALLRDTTDTDDSFYCRYPSRSQWLIDKLPAIVQEIKLPACEALRKERASLDAKSVTLILASAHINSPASAFGHTFLRVDSHLDTPLTAYAINYAAKTAETNGFIYAYQGLFGGYEGRYSISSYSEKVKEYSDLEQRDIWEYRLNLNDTEITRLVNHIFEVRHVYADYYFTSENCSYNLLWLLQIARPGINLTNQFGMSAIPIDTVRAIMNENLITEEVYRPSSRKRMVKLAENLTHTESRAFIQSTDFDVDKLDRLPVVEKISALELATFELKRRRSNNNIDHSRYTRDLLGLLKVRSHLGTPIYTEFEKPEAPSQGHLSRRMNAGVQYRQGLRNEVQMKLGSKLAYHDIYDHEDGFLPGAYISFFDTQVVATNNTVQLESLSVLDIRSYALQDTFFKPVSWQVQLGTKRLFEERQHGFLKTGGGITLGKKNLYGFMMVTPGIYVQRDIFAGGAVQLGLIGSVNQFKYGVQFSQEYFTKSRTQQMSEIFMTYRMTSRWAIHVKYERQQLTGQTVINTFGINALYYF